MTAKQKAFTHKRCARIIGDAFCRYVKTRYQDLIDNWEDNDVITQTPVHWIPQQLLIVVPTNNKRYGFNAMDLLRWMIRSPTNPITREEITDDIARRCIEISERFLKLELCRLTNQKTHRLRSRVRMWKSDEANLLECKCTIDQFRRRHMKRENLKMRREHFQKSVADQTGTMLNMMNTIRSTTVMNTITANIQHGKVQSINYNCTVSSMSERPVRRLIDKVSDILKLLDGHEDDSEDDSTYDDSDDDDSDDDDSDDEDSDDDSDDDTDNDSDDDSDDDSDNDSDDDSDDDSDNDSDDYVQIAFAMNVDSEPMDCGSSSK